MKPVKLVIWDLDDTFWKGTLSEGAIEYIQQNHETVIALARRGIMSAICSKNNYDDVRQLPVQQGIWDYFVFPKIAWQPKGAMVAELIADMHLRPENVLFIDDKSLNLNEALFYCPGIQTSSPEILAGLLSLDVCAGRPDLDLSRLKQYKMLEKKHADRVSAQCGNDEFLRGCRITVQLCHNCSAEIDRILELINRTNQLNYTKHWLTLSELEDLVHDAAWKQALSGCRINTVITASAGSMQKENGKTRAFFVFLQNHEYGGGELAVQQTRSAEHRRSRQVAVPLLAGQRLRLDCGSGSRGMPRVYRLQPAINPSALWSRAAATCCRYRIIC